MMMLKPHPAADIFPLFNKEDIGRLATDIQANGQREPIILFEGMILDGRNRYQACKIAKCKPVTTEFTGTRQEALSFVWSLNRIRRHLNSSQAAIAEVKREKLDAQYAAELEQARSDSKKRKGTGRPKKNSSQLIDLSSQDNTKRTDSKRAASAGTNRTYIKDAEKLLADEPELAEQVLAGAITITQAKRQIKERKREERREENRAKVEQVSEPTQKTDAKFATIVIDPPWDWGDEGDCDQLGRAKPDYATMTIDQLKGLAVADIADVDCHIYMWITNRSLPKGFMLLEAWGFRYVTMLTWPKPNFGLGNYFRGQTEHVLFGVRGSQMLSRKNASTLLPTWNRGKKHSQKPQEFYEFVESCSPGPYVEMFSRNVRKDWFSWGENG